MPLGRVLLGRVLLGRVLLGRCCELAEPGAIDRRGVWVARNLAVAERHRLDEILELGEAFRPADVDRQREPEARTLAGLSRRAHLAAHRLDQAPNDRQTQTDTAADLRAVARLALVEGEEQVLDLAGLETDALVDHRDLDRVAVGPEPGDHLDRAPIGGVLEGVLQQLAERRAHRLDVGDAPGGGRRAGR